jgi:hypothetical protein
MKPSPKWRVPHPTQLPIMLHPSSLQWDMWISIHILQFRIPQEDMKRN